MNNECPNESDSDQLIISPMLIHVGPTHVYTVTDEVCDVCEVLYRLTPISVSCMMWYDTETD